MAILCKPHTLFTTPSTFHIKHSTFASTFPPTSILSPVFRRNENMCRGALCQNSISDLPLAGAGFLARIKVPVNLFELSLAEVVAPLNENASELGIEAAVEGSAAPAWLSVAVLLFPAAGYALFNVYRDKLNPRATLQDFAFLLVAAFILFNVITTVFLKKSYAK